MCTDPVKEVPIEIYWVRVVKAGLVWRKYKVFRLLTIEFEFPNLGPIGNFREVIVELCNSLGCIISKG